MPTSYQYLPETSILRAILDLITEAGKLGQYTVITFFVVVALFPASLSLYVLPLTGPEAVRSEWLLLVLTSLVEGATSQCLPPVNWAGVLSPIMRMSYGESSWRISESGDLEEATVKHKISSAL